MSQLRASLIVPARNEDRLIGIFLERIAENVNLNIEVLVVVDSPKDSTLAELQSDKKTNLVCARLFQTLVPVLRMPSSLELRPLTAKSLS